MKKLLLILILTLSFQSLTKADDISDFQIEGMSIGDSALDFFKESHIKKNIWNFPDKKFKRVQNDELPFFKIYDAVDFNFKTGDKSYKIYSLNGILFYDDKDIKGCYKKMDEIVTEIDEIFKDLKKFPKRTYKHSNDKSGKSKITDIVYEFNNGDSVAIMCYDYSKAHGSQDHLSVSLSLQEFRDWIYTAYD